MDVQAWDSVFVRARRRDVHALVERVADWGLWWPGMTTTPLPRGAFVTLRHPGVLPRPRQRFAVEIAKNRAARALGIDLRYRGDVTGEAEFYYLDEPAGTVVTYLLRASVAEHRWRATLAHHRAGVRVGLDALKDRLEGDRIPGAEPDPRLLADQQAAMVEFRKGIEEWTRKQAGDTAEAPG